MDHRRKEIRKAIVQVLEDGAIPAVGERVYDSRIKSLNELPAILVYPGDESSEPANITDKSLRRSFPIVIEARVALNEGISDALDDLAEEIEKVMDAQDSFDLDYVTNIHLSGTEPGIYEGSMGERAAGAIRLSYQVQYFTTGEHDG